MSSERRGVGLTVLITGACLIIVIAGLRAAGPLIVPVLLSAYLAVLAAAPIRWLMARRVPSWAALPVVLGGVVVVFLLGGALVASSVRTFSARLPEYEQRIEALVGSGVALLEQQGLGVDLSGEALQGYLDAGRLANMAGTLVSSVADVLSDTAFVLLTTIFILAEAAGLPRKLEAAFGPSRELGRFSGVVDDLQNYLAIKTRISVTSGVLSGAMCWLVGVDFPLLWGLMAFLLNYIPTLGSIIALTPPTVLAFLMLDWQHALGLLAGYLTIEMVMGNVVEPRLMGKQLGLSSLVVFLSLVFWGWIWGTIGMFLSVPLTMVVKILLEHSGDLKWIAVLLGSGAEVREQLEHQVEAPPVVAAAESQREAVLEVVAAREVEPQLLDDAPLDDARLDDARLDDAPSEAGSDADTSRDDPPKA
jgi:predicted PurR-regulated permease PerM